MSEATVDYGHTNAAIEARREKARMLARWLYETGPLAALVGTLTPRHQREAERAAGVRRCSDETWALALDLLRQRLDWDARHMPPEPEPASSDPLRGGLRWSSSARCRAGAARPPGGARREARRELAGAGDDRHALPGGEGRAGAALLPAVRRHSRGASPPIWGRAGHALGGGANRPRRWRRNCRRTCCRPTAVRQHYGGTYGGTRQRL
jgi:hypothetical protein